VQGDLGRGGRPLPQPDEDLPKDFEARRVDYYTELRKPLDPAVFSGSLREEMTAALAELNDALPGLDWVDVAERRQGPIRLTPLDASPEPRNLRRIKNEVSRRWQAVPLIDILKEALLRTGALDQVASVAGGSLKPEILAERMMLAIYGYGTNTGIRAVLPVGGAHTEEDVRYVRRRYLTPPAAQAIAIGIANATFAARDTGLWGSASTAVASDSTHFRSWDQNLFTEWHARYGGGGILVYWHVEEKYVVVHSQVLKAARHRDEPDRGRYWGHASRRLSTQNVTARRIAASITKMPVSMPWNAQNLLAGW
jgi:Tn3 transposase DDE domain-containing protein